jgi:hypothetical protein
MRKTGLVLLAALAASSTIAGLAAAGPATLRTTFPAQATVSKAGSAATLSGRFTCAKRSSVWVRAWVFQGRTGALAEGRFPVHAATPAEKALGDCTGAARPWSVEALVKDTAPGRFRAGAATACYVLALRAHGRYESLASRCAPLRLR